LIEAVKARFGYGTGVSAIEEFQRAHQVNKVEEYMEKFSKSRARLLIENPYFQEDFFTGSFISGLKESIPHWVSATNTTTVEEAFPLARCAPLLLMKL